MRCSHLSAITSFVVFTLFGVSSGWTHPPGGDVPEHEHSDADRVAESVDDFFTTREGARYLPPADDESVFHFVVYGDRTGGVPAGLRVLEQAVRDTNLIDPDLVMTVGDLIQGYNQTPDWLREAEEFKQIMGQLQMRWYPVAGNHDIYWRGPDAPPPGHHEANYEKHFGPLWYSFRHKNAGFIVLYSDEGDPNTNEKAFNRGRLQTMSDAQLDFLQQALDDLVGSDHVFVFLHHPRWVGGGYRGGNWDKVHETLVGAGNVSAVFAGHIHHMRFDGPKDGIAYYTLATTGGNLSAEIPEAGYLHHLNLVSVRRKDYSVASIPVGAVMDPKEFTPEFLAEIDKARSIRPVRKAGELRLQVDGSAEGEFTYHLHNPSSRPVDGTLMLGTPGRPSRDWMTDLDHKHFTIAPGGSEQISLKLSRAAGRTEQLSVPVLRAELEFLAESSRIRLPAAETPMPLELSAVPADYFTDQPNRCLRLTDERSAVRVESDDIVMPNGPLTLEAWVKPADLAGYRAIVAKTQGSEYALFLDEGTPQFDIHLRGKYVSAHAETVIPANEWSHVAGVYDGNQVALYVNGQRVKSVTGSGTRRTNPLPLFLGADPDGNGNPTRGIVGWLDEVRLSSSAVYLSDFQPERRLSPRPDTKLMMHMDRALGPFVLDHGTTGVHGVMVRGAHLVPVE